MQGSVSGRTPGRSLFEIAAIAACVIIAAAVIASMRGELPVSGRVPGISFLTVLGAGGAALAAGIVVVILLLFLMLINLISRGLPKRGSVGVVPKSGSPLALILAIAIFAALLITVVHFGHFSGLKNITAQQHPLNNTTGITGGQSGGGVAGYFLSLLTVTLFIPLLGIVLLLAIFAIALLFRGPAEKREEGVLAERIALAREVEKEIAEIDQGKDPRRAVIEIYGEMRTRLSSAGAWDMATFTAREFAGRAVERLGLSSGSVNGLTYLYEEAKFSLHNVGEGQKKSALELLHRIADELSGRAVS